MIVLVLMPLDERAVYMGTKVYTCLEEDVQKHAFCVPMYMQYAVTSGLVESWEAAGFYALLAAKNIYKTAKEKGDSLLILGNLPKEFAVDVVFNMQSIDIDEPYSDPFLAKMREKAQSEAVLNQLVQNYSAEDSTFTLHNCQATADFLTRYLRTDPAITIQQLQAEYRERLMEMKDNLYARDFKN